MVPLNERFVWNSLIGLGFGFMASGMCQFAQARSVDRPASPTDSQGWEEFLIRVDLPEPTLENLSRLFNVPVKGFSHVDENLYKIILPQGFNGKSSVLESGFISHLQKNFIYRPALVSPYSKITVKRSESETEEDDTVSADPEVLEPIGTPGNGTDPGLGKQWGLEKTRTPQAWQITRGREDIIVAVIDSGIDYNHEDLRQNIWRNPAEIAGNGRDDDGNGYIDDIVGWDFADDDAFPYDITADVSAGGNPGHGTHCAGVVAAVGRNDRGISGVAPNVKVMGLRFITEKGEGTTEAAIKAIKYAVNNGATILSNSWGGEEPDEADAELKRVLKWAQDRGALLVFAAGNGREGIGYNNDTDSNPTVPASFSLEGILSVAAIDRQDRLGAFSNFGVKTVDLAAPGVRVYSTVPKNRYEDRVSLFGVPVGDWSGTSMATPHVAGAAALIKSLNPNLSGLQIKEILLQSARLLPQLKTRVSSGGTLDVLQALELAKNY